MVSADSQTFVREMFDLQLDYNIKLIIFGCIIFYAVLFFYLNKKIEIDSFSKMIFKLFSTIYIYITVIFLPLFTIMLFSEYQAISLWTLMLQVYGGAFVIMALSLIVLGWQKVLDVVGIDINYGIMTRETKRKGEE